MGRAPKTTTAPTGSIAPLGLRLLPDLRQKIEESARANGRSMNAEVSARLEASFTEAPASLPQPVQEAIAMEIADNGGTEAEALTRLVLAGQAHGGTFLYATISPNTTFQQFREMLDAGKKIIPPDAVIVMESGKKE